MMNGMVSLFSPCFLFHRLLTKAVRFGAPDPPLLYIEFTMFVYLNALTTDISCGILETEVMHSLHAGSRGFRPHIT